MSILTPSPLLSLHSSLLVRLVWGGHSPGPDRGVLTPHITGGVGGVGTALSASGGRASGGFTVRSRNGQAGPASREGPSPNKQTQSASANTGVGIKEPSWPAQHVL